jgi:hypothetical protein
VSDYCTVCRHLDGLDDEQRARFFAELRAISGTERLARHGNVVGVGQRPDGNGTLWLDRLDVQTHVGEGRSLAHLRSKDYHRDEYLIRP